MSMKKLKLLFAACALLVTAGVQAKTDVTSTYLVDADLSSLNGWGNPGKTDWKTDGAVNVVEFWNWSNQFNFSQTANLPAGYYRLAVNAFYRNSWGGDGTNNDMAWIFAGEKTQNVIALNSMNDLSGYAGSNDLYRAATAFSQGKFSNEFDFNVTGEGTVAVEIGFKGTCPDGGWCILGPVTLWEYTAEDYMEDYREKVAIAEPLLTQKMNSGVLQALNDAIVEESTLTTVDDVQNAVSTLVEATNNANTSIANYTEAKTILDAANTYDETGQASYAADETIAAIQSAYDDGSLTALTTDQKTAAQTALATACKAQTQPADGCDMTAYVQNWDFLNCAKDNFPNWTISKSDGTAQNFGTTAAEYWNGSAAGGGFDFYQNVTDLPVGVYTIQGNMWNSTDNESGAAGVDGECGVYGISSSADVFAGVTVDTRDGGKATYTTKDIVVIDGKLRLGVKNKATMGGRWFGVDWIKLTYSRQLNADELEEIEMETAKKAYEEALAAAQGITEGSIPTSAYSTLQGIINDNTLSEGATTTDYNNAASALNSATDDATPLVVPYAAWKALKAQADALVIVSNDNEEANSTLTTAISTQALVADAATTATEINTATSELKSAMTTYVGAANPVGDGAQFDCTFMLSDNDLTGYISRQKLSSWYTDQTFNSQNSQTMTDNSSVANSSDNTKYAMYEYWSGSVEATSGYTVYQKYTLPAGTYRMDALCCVGYGWATRYEDASTRNTNITFSAGDVDGTNITTGTLEPATLEFVQASESEVKIGLKAQAGNTANWMGIGYVELYKIPAQAFTVDEDVAWNYEQSGAGDVTLNRTIKAGVNTLVLPFSMTQDEVESTFGEGSVVYVVDSYDSDKNSISFKQKSGISPNEPCLLKAAEEGTSYSLLGRTIVAASANPTIGGTDVTMTGSYAATAYIPLNSYVVNGGNLYKVDQEESVSMKNTRAYITVPKSADARTITISFDNGATGIATLDGGEMKFEAGTIYDLSGRKVTNPAKGIYIMNGKKVIK